jgi:hypothetical protein
MRIFLVPPDQNSSMAEFLGRACDVLRLSLISSARIGGIVDDRPVLLVDDPDVPKAVAVLKKSGIEAVTD